MVAVTGWQSLGPDEVRWVLLYLTHEDVRSVASTCRALRALCAEDALWQRLARDWAGAHGVAQPFSPPLARASLRLASSVSVFYALRRLGGDPLGTWRLVAPPPLLLPRGDVVRISLLGGALIGERVVPGPAAASREPPRFSVRFTEPSTPARANGFVALVPSKENSSLRVDGDTLSVADAPPEPPPGALRLSDRMRRLMRGGGAAPGPETREAWAETSPTRALPPPATLYERVSFAAQPAAFPSPPCGVYYAPYGPHGEELIAVSFASDEAEWDEPFPSEHAARVSTMGSQPLPPVHTLPPSPYRLEGFKLTVRGL